MKWIQATLTFNPDQVSRSRSNGFGVWRVHHCTKVDNPLKMRVEETVWYSRPVLRLMVARPYKRGVMVNPRTLALDFLRACRQEEALRRVMMHSPTLGGVAYPRAGGKFMVQKPKQPYVWMYDRAQAARNPEFEAAYDYFVRQLEQHHAQPNP